MKRTPLLWKKTDEQVVLKNCPDHSSIGVYYAFIYTPGAGFEFSEENRLIINLKKPIDRPQVELQYKEESIKRFAEDLIGAFQGAKTRDRRYYLVPTPPSATTQNVRYDDRLTRVVTLITDIAKNTLHFPALTRVHDVEPLHLSKGERDPEKIYNSLRINEDIAKEFKEDGTIALIDDVLTEGTTFTACRRRLNERFPGARVIGIFWARSVPSLF